MKKDKGSLLVAKNKIVMASFFDLSSASLCEDIPGAFFMYLIINY